MHRTLLNFFKSDRYLSSTVIIAFLQFFFLTILFLVFYSKLPDKLPLLYSLSWGEGQLVGKGQFIIVPAMIILITLVNLSLVSQLHSSQIFLKRMLFMANIVTTTILFISALKIMMIFI